MQGSSMVDVVSSKLNHNSGTKGGAVYVKEASLRANSTQFNANSASETGGQWHVLLSFMTRSIVGVFYLVRSKGVKIYGAELTANQVIFAQW